MAGPKASGLPYEGQDWYKDNNAKPRVLSEAKFEFIDWILDPRPASPQGKGTQKQWAIDHGFTHNYVSAWKKDPLFKEGLAKKATELNISPERTQMVVNALFEKAAAGDTKAAQLYLQYTGQFMPTTKIITHDKGLADLSDEELAELGTNILTMRRSANNG